MARRATIDDILSTGEKELIYVCTGGHPLRDEAGQATGEICPGGEDRTIRVRKVHAGARDALMPPLPAHLYEGLPDEPEKRIEVLTERRSKWLGSLAPAELDARTHEAGQFFARLVARASVDPVLTEAQAERLGDAVVTLANEIILFSQNKGNTPKPVPAAG